MNLLETLKEQEREGIVRLRAISLWQPWAELLVRGLKQYETRGWFTNLTGPILIHAANKWDKIGKTFLRHGCGTGLPIGFSEKDLAFGAVIGLVDFVGATPAGKIVDYLSEREKCFGDFSRGRFAWKMATLPSSPSRLRYPAVKGSSWSISRSNTWSNEGKDSSRADGCFDGVYAPRVLDDLDAGACRRSSYRVGFLQTKTMNFNKVIIGGYLARDPEIRYTTEGKAINNFTVGTNRSWTSESGEKKEESTFVDFTAFGRTAEVIAQYMKKGMPLLVEGRLKTDQWEDRQTGQKRYKLKVVVETFSFVGGKENATGNEGNASRPARKTSGAERVTPSEGVDYPATDDDVPF